MVGKKALPMKILTQAFEPLQTQSYLLIGENEAVWIDPAPLSGAWVDAILPAAARAKAIVLTHSHWDHISAIGQSKRFSQAPIYVHRQDSENVKNPGSDCLFWPESVPLPKLRNSSLHLIEEGFEWCVGTHRFITFHTPGHSPGSCVFFCPALELMISGDTLFSMGYGRVDLPTGNASEMKKSLKKLSHFPKETRLFPGHGSSALLKELSWLHDEI